MWVPMVETYIEKEILFQPKGSTKNLQTPDIWRIEVLQLQIYDGHSGYTH